MLSWSQFTGRSDIRILDINEQKRLYYVYQNDYYWRVSVGGGSRRGIVSDSFLLQENGFYLLQESGSKIKL